MPLIENKVSDFLLSLLRKRRARRTATHVRPAPGSSLARQNGVTRREVQFSDVEAVVNLKRRSRLRPDSLENWQHLWKQNPTCQDGLSKFSMGWVLEAGGQIVGYLGSLPLLYHYGDRTLTAAVATGFAVEPEYRGFSLLLVASFLRQENVDLFLNTTAIEAVGKIMTAFKAVPLPQPDYDNVLFWVLDERHFANAVVKKLKVDGTLGRLAGALGFLTLYSDRVIRRKRPYSRTGADVDERNVSDVGDDFYELWMTKSKQDPRLLAERTPAVLRWHFTTPQSQQGVRVLCHHSGRRLIGYAIVTTELNQEIGLRTVRLVDLFVEHDDPQVVEGLLIAAYEYARNSGSHVLEVLGFPNQVRQICRKWKPYSRRYPACPFYYKARDQTLHERLATEDAWYAGPFDGDTSLG